MSKRIFWGPDYGIRSVHWDDTKAWLEANKIDPKEILEEANIVVTDEFIEYTSLRRDKAGALIIQDGHALTAQVVFPLIATPENFNL